MPNGHKRTPSDAAKFAQFAQFAQGPLSPSFPEADALLSLFKNSCTQLSDLRTQVFFWIVNSWKVFYMGLFFILIYYVCQRLMEDFTMSRERWLPKTLSIAKH